MKPLALLCILLIGLGGVLVVVFKKMIMRNFGEITAGNIFNIMTWFKLFTNPWVIALLLFTLCFFALSMVAYSLEDASKVIVVSSGLSPLFFSINILINKYVLKETLSANQTLGVFLIIGSMILGFSAVYFGGLKT